MKPRGIIRVAGRLAATLTVAVAVVGMLSGCAKPEWSIETPYAAVDWQNDGRYKANFHTHTTGSDGRLNPHEVVDWYHAHGYSILAITDHNRVTYPWTGFTDLEPSDGARRRLANNQLETESLDREDRDPAALGMVAIQGNELSRHHHTGSFFNDHDGATTTEEASLDSVTARGGIAMLYHPGRYDRPVEWYAELYTNYPVLFGLEVYNQGDRYPGDREKWDEILTALGLERPVWAFSNDDMHTTRHLGRNWNIMMLPELSDEWVRRGMLEGRNLFVYAPEGHSGPQPPVVASIDVDKRAGTITINATGYDRIEWISEGMLVHEGETVDLSAIEELGSYVRAMVYAQEGESVVGTQPFYVSSP